MCPRHSGAGMSQTLSTCHGLMFSWVPFCPENPNSGRASANAGNRKVFSAVVVIMHPSQKVSSIKEAVDMLLVISHDLVGRPVAALCCLPELGIGKLYPCLGHNTALMSLFSMHQDSPMLHLNTLIRHCEEFTIRHLHQWMGPYGPVVALPLLYSPNPGLPSVYSLDKPAMLWTNSKHLAAPSDNDDNICGVGPPHNDFCFD